MIRVLYLARLRDEIGVSNENVPSAQNVSALLAYLRARGAPWAEALAPGRTFKVAVNKQIAEDTTPIHTGDEVAFLPPVTGG